MVESEPKDEVATIEREFKLLSEKTFNLLMLLFCLYLSIFCSNKMCTVCSFDVIYTELT